MSSGDCRIYDMSMRIILRLYVSAVHTSVFDLSDLGFRVFRTLPFYRPCQGSIKIRSYGSTRLNHMPKKLWIRWGQLSYKEKNQTSLNTNSEQYGPQHKRPLETQEGLIQLFWYHCEAIAQLEDYKAFKYLGEHKIPRVAKNELKTLATSRSTWKKA